MMKPASERLFNVSGDIDAVVVISAKGALAKALNEKYAQWKARGLEIISISLDDNKQAWLKAVEEDKIQWIQLADLAGFKGSRVARDYKISQVPTVYLIDPQGEILCTNPTEEELLNLP